MTRGITERPDGVSVETPADFASTSQTTELPAVDDWGQIMSSTPQPGSQEAIRRSAAAADLELDDVWVQPQLYVTTRQFRNNRSIIGRLPPAAKNTLSVAGICHYLCVYRSERGELYQFDFGPFGGDVHSRLLSDTGGEKKSAQENSNATPGHVRERRLNAIPQEGTYLVGRTSMTLEDIRGFNATRDTMYQVNKNDCRHFVNDLCLEGTGVQKVCSKYVRGEVFGNSILSPAALYAGEAASPEAKDLAEAAEKERARRRKARELAVLLPILAVADLENVPVWDRLGQASTAALFVGASLWLAVWLSLGSPRKLAACLTDLCVYCLPNASVSCMCSSPCLLRCLLLCLLCLEAWRSLCLTLSSSSADSSSAALPCAFVGRASIADEERSCDAWSCTTAAF